MPVISIKTSEGTYHGDYILIEDNQVLLRIEDYGTVNQIDISDIIMIKHYEP